MSEMDLEKQITIGDQNVSLADLAGIDMGGVKAVRFKNLPKGNYDLKVDGPGEFDIVELDGVANAIIKVKHLVLEAHALVDPTEDAKAQIGEPHVETFFCKTVDGIGRFKAYLEDSGFEGSGSLQEIMILLDGHAFNANIKHAKSKKDPDIVYSNLQFNKKKKA